MKGTWTCAHHEIVKRTGEQIGEEIGVCVHCGQQRLYYNDVDGKRAARVIGSTALITFKEVKVGESATTYGDTPVGVKPSQGPKGRLGEKAKKELFQIGVKKYAEKHGYRHTGMLTSVYNKMKAEAEAERQLRQRQAEADLLRVTTVDSQEDKTVHTVEVSVPLPTVPATEDEELQVISKCLEEIRKQQPPAIKRIVCYLYDRFADMPLSPLPKRSVEGEHPDGNQEESDTGVG